MEDKLKVSAVGIKKVLYCDVKDVNTTDGSVLRTDLTPEMVKALIASAQNVENVHQDTWQFEESEASQDSYKNQLTGLTYRMGTKTLGDVVINFTIGRYDYETKAALLGGNVITNADGKAIGWSRAHHEKAKNIFKAIFGLTEDDQWVIFTNANMTVRESNTDNAIGLAVTATAMESDNANLSSEYWYADEEVHKLSVQLPGGKGE